MTNEMSYKAVKKDTNLPIELEYLHKLIDEKDNELIYRQLQRLEQQGTRLENSKYDFLFEYIYNPIELSRDIVQALLRMGNLLYPRTIERIYGMIDRVPNYGGDALSHDDCVFLLDILITNDQGIFFPYLK